MDTKSRVQSLTRGALSLGLVGAAALLGAGFASHSTETAAATSFKVNVGNGARGLSVEEFMPRSISVHQDDTIQFTNPYEEIHTVTFTAGGPTPELIEPVPGPAAAGPPKLMFNPVVAFPSDQASTLHFDGKRYANSGILNKGQSWSVTFRSQGTFTFLCVLHPGMEASVKVVAADVSIPEQGRLDTDAAARLASVLEAGEAGAARATPGKTTNANGSTTWEVVNPASVGQVDVMRFVAPRLQIAAGDSVLWKNDTPVPHTVTFTSGAPAPELVLPEPQAGGPPNLVLNPRVLLPVVPSTTYAGTGYVNSGFISAGPEGLAGTSFRLTFSTPGTYLYICVLHADQGMAGVVEVTGVAIRPPATGDAGLLKADAGRSSVEVALYGLAVGGALGALAAGRLALRAHV